MREKMRFLILLVICMTGIRCNLFTSSKYEYRYNVEVIYTRPADAELWPDLYGRDVLLDLYLYDPQSQYHNIGYQIVMHTIGVNTFRCLIDKLYIQRPGETKHRLGITDTQQQNYFTDAKNISVQGAYDLEIAELSGSSFLFFRIAKN